MFKPGQALRIHNLWFEVEGVFLGAIGQTSLIGLIPLSQTPGTAHGNTEREMFVPEAILKAALAGGAALYEPADVKIIREVEA